MLSQGTSAQVLQIQIWTIDRLIFYARNPRKNDSAVDRICASIREFGFKIPVLAWSDGEDFDLSLTGFNPGEIDGLLAIPDEERANEVPPVPENPASRAGDLWICGEHRVLCGDATRAEDVARLLGDRKPILMVTDPPYGIELDSEWRDRAGLNTAPGQK